MMRLRQMMRLRRAFVPYPLSRYGEEDLVLAIQRCLDCACERRCDALLAMGDAQGYERFCPNAEYIERRRRGSLQFK